MPSAPPPPHWDELTSHVVVLDLSSPFIYIGRLSTQQGHYLLLEQADAHDLRDSPNTTREQYVLEARRHGVTPNRNWVWVRIEEVVSVSRLDDVVMV